MSKTPNYQQPSTPMLRMKPFLRKTVLLTLIAGVILNGNAALGSVDNESSIITLENGLLTMHLQNASMLDVLTQIADKSDIEFEIKANIQATISSRIIRMPIEKGLKKFLKRYSYITVYEANKTNPETVDVKKIIIYAGPEIIPGSNQVLRGSISTLSPRIPNSTEHEETLDDYVKMLASTDPEERLDAVVDMAHFYEEASLDHLGDILLHDGDEMVKISAAEEIGILANEKSITALTSALNDPHDDVREAVVEALGEISSARVIPSLEVALGDSNEDIREIAVDLLGEIGGNDSIRALKNALDDESELVRESAAAYIFEIKNENAL